MINNERNKKAFHLLSKYVPGVEHPVVVGKDNRIYDGENKTFVDVIAFLYGKTYQDETPLDLLKNMDLRILSNVAEYNSSYMPLDDSDFDKITTIFNSKFSQNEFANKLGSTILINYLNSKYKNDDQPQFLKDFIQENLDDIKELANRNELFMIIGDVAKRAQMIDKIYDFKNDSEILRLHKLDLMPFEIGRYERFADKVVSEIKTFKNEQGEDKSYQQKILYVSDKKIENLPFLRGLVNRELVYFYACPENSDLNRIGSGRYSASEFKKDPSTELAYRIGHQNKTAKLYQHDFSMKAYYIYTDLLSAEYMQKNGFIGKDIDSFKKYESQISLLKSRWLTLSVSIPSVEQQTQELIGDYIQKGKRLALAEDKGANSHIQTNETKPFFNYNAGLFNVETGFTIWDFKQQKSHIIKHFDTIKCINMPGFGTNATTFRNFVLDTRAREEFLQEQAEKQAEKERQREKEFLEKSIEIVEKYNSLKISKNAFLHPYFEAHGIDNTKEKAIFKFAELPKYKEDNGEKIVCPCVPYFGLDEEKRIRLYTLETIKYHKEDDGRLIKWKGKEKDARAKGTFAVAGVDSYNDLINALETKKTIYLAEGFATAMAVNKITGDICLATGSIGNFSNVIQDLRNARSDLGFMLCIDNDCFKYAETNINPSVSHINNCLDEKTIPQDVKIIVPRFYETDKKGSDWADKIIANSLESVKQEFKERTMTAQEFQSRQLQLFAPEKPSEKLMQGEKY